MGCEGKVSDNKLGQHGKAFEGLFMKYNPNFNRNVIASQVMKPHHSFFKSTLCLNNKVMFRIDIGIKRNSQHNIGMIDLTELLSEGAVIEHATISQDV